MNHSEKFTSSITEIYAELVMHQVYADYPGFQPANGHIIYDDEYEMYLYVGFTEDEIMIIKAVEQKIYREMTIKPAA